MAYSKKHYHHEFSFVQAFVNYKLNYLNYVNYWITTNGLNLSVYEVETV